MNLIQSIKGIEFLKAFITRNVKKCEKKLYLVKGENYTVILLTC